MQRVAWFQVLVYLKAEKQKQKTGRIAITKDKSTPRIEQEYRRDLSPERKLTVEFMSDKRGERNNTNSNKDVVAVVVKFSL